jgi:hypothetical protein
MAAQGTANDASASERVPFTVVHTNCASDAA